MLHTHTFVFRWLLCHQNLQMLVGTGTLDTDVVFRATLQDANFAFRRITYTPRPLENGEDRIVITVNDTGFSGTYGKAQVTHFTGWMTGAVVWQHF